MAIVVLTAILSLASPAFADAPARVMSMNVCTDQLAMQLAAPGQLVSVSFLADDPDLAFLHEQAKAYPENHGSAEEVFLVRPDLVVTSAYTLQNAATAMLRDLGFRVEEFQFTQTVASIPGEIRRMGRLLGREDKAEAVAGEFEAELAAVEASVCEPRPTAIAYEQNGIALGQGTLAGSVIEAAGFRNLAAELGYQGMTPFPLEELVMRRPDAIILRHPLDDAPALADQIAHHPAIAALEDTATGVFVPRGSWSCGGPFVIEAVKALRELREKIAPCGADAAK